MKEEEAANAFPNFKHRNTATTINSTKQKHRSSLKLRDWVKDNYAKRPEVLDRLAVLDRSEASVCVDEVDDKKISVSQLTERYVVSELPVLI